MGASRSRVVNNVRFIAELELRFAGVDGNGDGRRLASAIRGDIAFDIGRCGAQAHLSINEQQVSFLTAFRGRVPHSSVHGFVCSVCVLHINCSDLLIVTKQGGAYKFFHSVSR